MFKSILSTTAFLALASALPSVDRLATRGSGVEYPPVDPAAIMAVSPSSFPSYKTGGLIREGDAAVNGTVTKRWTCSSSAVLTWGDADNGGKGVTINNADSDWRGFYVYHNSCEYVPYKYIWIAAGATQFVSLPDQFQGRIVRGVDSSMLSGQPQTLASWLEIGLDDAGVMWGDVSLIRGCDGGILMWDPKNGNSWKGFTQWILDGAPSGSYDQKTDGQWVIKYTENADQSLNTVPRDYLIQKVGTDAVYVDDHHGNPVIASQSGRFATYWPAGRA